MAPAPISSLITGRSAHISDDERYRYNLVRRLAHNPEFPEVGHRDAVVTFVGLNPSTADGAVDDPTIRRCVRYAYDWGFSTLLMVNLFALRATDPKELPRNVGNDPIGPLNDEAIGSAVRASSLVVAAWGANQFARPRGTRVSHGGLLGEYAVLGKTKAGDPRHPLYVSKTALPVHHRTMAPVALPARDVGVSPLDG